MNDIFPEERRIEIAMLLQHHADAITKQVVIAFPKKKFLPKRGNYRRRKQERQMEATQVALMGCMAAADLYAVLARPIPRPGVKDYADGSPTTIPAILNEKDFIDRERHFKIPEPMRLPPGQYLV